MATKGENNFQYSPRKFICANCGHVNVSATALTSRQLEVLEFIRGQEKFPTLKAIAKHFNFRISAAHVHVQRLVKKGFIKHVNKYELK